MAAPPAIFEVVHPGTPPPAFGREVAQRRMWGELHGDRLTGVNTVSKVKATAVGACRAQCPRCAGQRAGTTAAASIPSQRSGLPTRTIASRRPPAFTTYHSAIKILRAQRTATLATAFATRTADLARRPLTSPVTQRDSDVESGLTPDRFGRAEAQAKCVRLATGRLEHSRVMRDNARSTSSDRQSRSRRGHRPVTTYRLDRTIHVPRSGGPR